MLRAGAVNGSRSIRTLPASLDGDPSRIRHLSIDSHGQINFAQARQGSRQSHIELIESRKCRLRPYVKHRNLNGADCHFRRRFRAAETPARAEERQKDLIRFRAEINWRRYKSVLRRIESRYWFVACGAASRDSQRHCRNHALTTGVSGEYSWGNSGYLGSRAGSVPVAVG